MSDARSNSRRARSSLCAGIDPVLHDVAGVRRERDLAARGVVGDPADELGVHLGVALGQVLGVGDVRDGEVVGGGVGESAVDSGCEGRLGARTVLHEEGDAVVAQVFGRELAAQR